MSVTRVGIVYYADDPLKQVFRVVFPELDDKELDESPTDGQRSPYLNDSGKPHTWTSFGTDPSRVAVMEKVVKNDSRVAGFLSKIGLT